MATPSDYEWFARATGYPPRSDFRALKAVDAAGITRGMVGYDSWLNRTCFMHVAMDTPAAIRCLLRPAFESLFVDCGFEVAMGLTRSSLTRALDLARHLGFREVYRIRDGWCPGEDLVLSEMRRDECRWLKRERRAAA